MKLILVRHGESTSNLDNLFTGWANPPLTAKGIAEAEQAGRILAELPFTIDSVHTSLVTRTNQTTFYLLRAMNALWLPVHKHWRLNGRNYGALEGQNKDAMREKYGAEQVAEWRRSYSVRPPEASHAKEAPQYRYLDQHLLPSAESLQETSTRLLPYLEDAIVPELKHHKNVLIVSHGNLLRALTMMLEQIDPADIRKTEIRTAEPIVYSLSDDLTIEDKHIYRKA